MLSSLSRRLGGHPRRTLLSVLVFVALAGAIGGPLAGALKSSGGFVPAGSDSQLATARIEAATGRQAAAGVVLAVATPQGASAGRAQIAAAGSRLARVTGVAAVSAPAAVARDGRHVLVTGTLAAGANESAVTGATLHAFAGDHGVTVGGPVVANHQISATVGGDLGHAELLALPALILLSLVFFRGRAALMPLLVGVTTVLGTFLALTGINQFYGLSVFALNLVIGLGLGLSIDYTLFMLTRYREELSAGREPAEAARITVTHAGRTVLFSAATVAGALVTLVVFPAGFARSMGIAGATVAIVAALATVLVTPALLGLWGSRLARPDGQDVRAGRWYRLASAVMRRPGPVALLTAAVMAAAALPALGAHWTPVDRAVIPVGQSARTVADLVAADFPGAGRTPVTVTIAAPAAAGRAVQRYAARLSALPGVAVGAAGRDLGHDTWTVALTAQGDSAGPRAQRLVAAIRDGRAPFPVHVAGDAAAFLDQQGSIASHLPIAIALLAGLTCLVLWLMTDSVVLPVKALVMNALTVGASLAPLVLIYQAGRLTGLLGYTGNGGIEPSDFLVTATLVFALSTDYGVFLLGRIKEARDAGAPEREAVALGVGATGRVVTAAAILLAVAIGAFSTSSISFIQQIGIATATGVLIDAFIVRSLLVPSLMALLGRANWYSPAWLRALRRRAGGPAQTGRRAAADPLGASSS
ncbi:MAG TPA: MMPL family transporter [Solirubrobacteraceae bacterium]|nr:MMPL family transporter [Solirubrobacteraceae bacterium]